MWQNTRTEGEGLVKVFFGKAIMAEFQFSWSSAVEVGIQQPKRVKICNMVTTDLVSTDEELHLEKEKGVTTSSQDMICMKRAKQKEAINPPPDVD